MRKPFNEMSQHEFLSILRAVDEKQAAAKGVHLEIVHMWNVPNDLPSGAGSVVSEVHIAERPPLLTGSTGTNWVSLSQSIQRGQKAQASVACPYALSSPNWE